MGIAIMIDSSVETLPMQRFMQDLVRGSQSASSSSSSSSSVAASTTRKRNSGGNSINDDDDPSADSSARSVLDFHTSTTNNNSVNNSVNNSNSNNNIDATINSVNSAISNSNSIGGVSTHSRHSSCADDTFDIHGLVLVSDNAKVFAKARPKRATAPLTSASWHSSSELRKMYTADARWGSTSESSNNNNSNNANSTFGALRQQTTTTSTSATTQSMKNRPFPAVTRTTTRTTSATQLDRPPSLGRLVRNRNSYKSTNNNNNSNSNNNSNNNSSSDNPPTFPRPLRRQTSDSCLSIPTRSWMKPQHRQQQKQQQSPIPETSSKNNSYINTSKIRKTGKLAGGAKPTKPQASLSVSKKAASRFSAFPLETAIRAKRSGRPAPPYPTSSSESLVSFASTNDGSSVRSFASGGGSVSSSSSSPPVRSKPNHGQQQQQRLLPRRQAAAPPRRRVRPTASASSDSLPSVNSFASNDGSFSNHSVSNKSFASATSDSEHDNGHNDGHNDDDSCGYHSSESYNTSLLGNNNTDTIFAGRRNVRDSKELISVGKTNWDDLMESGSSHSVNSSWSPQNPARNSRRGRRPGHNDASTNTNTNAMAMAMTSRSEHGTSNSISTNNNARYSSRQLSSPHYKFDPIPPSLLVPYDRFQADPSVLRKGFSRSRSAVTSTNTNTFRQQQQHHQQIHSYNKNASYETPLPGGGFRSKNNNNTMAASVFRSGESTKGGSSNSSSRRGPRLSRSRSSKSSGSKLSQGLLGGGSTRNPGAGSSSRNYYGNTNNTNNTNTNHGHQRGLPTSSQSAHQHRTSSLELALGDMAPKRKSKTKTNKTLARSKSSD